jgi:hypothetical protein
VTALKGALEKERKRGKAADAWAKLFPDAKPEEIAELVKKAKARGGDGSPDKKADEDIDRLLKKRETEVRDEYKGIESERETLRKENRALKMNGARRAAAEKAEVFPDMIDDALGLSEKYFDVDDKGKITVLDEDGDPTSMTVEKFYATKFKELKPRFYKGTGSSGAGSETPSKKAPAKGGEDKSPNDKIAAGLAARAGK